MLPFRASNMSGPTAGTPAFLTRTVSERKQRFLEAGLPHFSDSFWCLHKTNLLDCAIDSQAQPNSSEFSLLVPIRILIITMARSGTWQWE
jgi:hypothetical protein